MIRNHIKSAIDPCYLKHAYIPDIYGKERRKRTAGKEGKLGVEGMSREIILESLRSAGATIEGEEDKSPSGITKQDMIELGLSGGQGSSLRRIQLMKRLNLPAHLSANALLQALNMLCTYEELSELVQSLENEND